MRWFGLYPLISFISKITVIAGLPLLPGAQMFTTAGHRTETLQRVHLPTVGVKKQVSVRYE